MLARVKKSHAKKDRTRAFMEASERRIAQMDQVDFSGIGKLASETFGSAEKANAWFYRPHPALGRRTPFSLLTNPTGEKRVKQLIEKIKQGVLR
ncbi:MAG: antitoxin Xre/MbcA/ParS toxin-binding domain-containing protein [Nitrospiraceae bacterium]